MFVFNLQPPFQDCKMNQNKLLGQVAFATQYAKIKADGKRETYQDAMDRVNAHCQISPIGSYYHKSF